VTFETLIFITAVFWMENLMARDHSEDLGVVEKILKWILGK
jgi:hypothetical protein